MTSLTSNQLQVQKPTIVISAQSEFAHAGQTSGQSNVSLTMTEKSVSISWTSTVRYVVASPSQSHHR
jgi:hypothetical protein